MADESVNNRVLAEPERRSPVSPIGLVRRIGSNLGPLLVLVALVLAWFEVTRVFRISAVILPSPLDVAGVFQTSMPDLWSNSLVTLREIIIGYAVSVAVGVPLGVLLASSRKLTAAVFPLLVGAQTLPKVAIAPLLVVWLGFGIVPKILMTFLVAFFPILVNVDAGVRSVPTEMVELGRVIHLSRWGLLRRIILPNALPQTFSGLKVAMTLAVIGALVGEFVGANEGLGYMLMASTGNFNTPLMFAVLVVVTVWGILLYMLMELIEMVAVPWHVSRRKKG